MDGYTDPVEALKTWINRQATLVGADRPLAGGADDKRRRSPGQGAYVVLTWLANPWELSEAPIHTAVVSCAVYGATEPNARKAAVALANALRRLDGETVPVGDANILCVETVTGPAYLADGGEHRYLLDATVNLEPA